MKKAKRGGSQAVCVVDVGNTSTTVARVQGERVGRTVRLRGAEQNAAAIGRAIDQVAGEKGVVGAALSSVVPAVVAVWTAQLRRRLNCDPLVVHHKLKLGVGLDYPRPSTIGADRLANASGAVARYGAPVIVADFGTAVTFDVVSAQAEYVGGVIAPGLPLMTDYLAERTALLPHISLGGRVRGPLGRSTRAGMRIGAQVGYGGMVAAIAEHIRQALSIPQVTLCATGGFAHWVLDQVELPFRFDPTLTLYGISRIYWLNAG